MVNLTYATGTYSSTNIYSGATALTAYYEQQANAGQIYAVDEQGKLIETLDIFWLEPLSTGSLPVITPEYHITTGGKTYEILQVSDQGGMGENLKVSCRLRTPQT